MVFLNEKKFACQTCIKGHRSSACNHTDRPLFEIKRKGRPVTQCEHCRELRKTKQVHVKCQCEYKDDVHVVPPPSSKRGRKAHIPPTFPHGLGAEGVDLTAVSNALSSNSRVNDHSSSCDCKSGGVCNCCTPRNSTLKTTAPSSSSGSTPPPLSTPQEPLPFYMPPVPAYEITPHIVSELQIPPYISSTDSSPTDYYPPNVDGPVIQRHGFDVGADVNGMQDDSFQIHNQHGYPPNVPIDATSSSFFPSGLWPDSQSLLPPMPLFGSCGCGVTCGCPGCGQHRGSDAYMSGSPTACPTSCSTCLDCGGTSYAQLPPAFQPTTSFTPSPTSPVSPMYAQSARGNSDFPWSPVLPSEPAQSMTAYSSSGEGEAMEESSHRGFAVSGERGGCCQDKTANVNSGQEARQSSSLFANFGVRARQFTSGQGFASSKSGGSSSGTHSGHLQRSKPHCPTSHSSKLGLKRLLPKPTTQPIQQQPPSLLSTQMGLAQHRGMAAITNSMPFNPHI